MWRASSQSGEAPGRSTRVEALARGLAILATFSGHEPDLGLSEIARRVGLTTPTTLRLLNTLRELGYVEQSAVTKKYRPGLAVLGLGYAAIAGLGMREVALPYLQRLSDLTSETVNLAVLAGAEIVYIERIKRTELISANVHVGSRLPAYSTSMGKVLLAHLTPGERDVALAGLTLDATGPKTITNRQALERELADIRQRGFAIQDEELMAGLRSIATPIRDSSGRVVAAINIAVSTRRVPRESLVKHLAPPMLQTAAAISTALGMRTPPSASTAHVDGIREGTWLSTGA